MRTQMTSSIVTTMLGGTALIVVVVLGTTAGTTPRPWAKRFDITVVATDTDEQGRSWEPTRRLGPVWPLPAITLAAASPPDMMLCIADAAGSLQCHHRDGVLPCRIGAAGMVVCSGLTKHLSSPCQESYSCVFRDVPVPNDTFGVLILEMEPPAFGMPRHRLIGGLVVAQAPSAPSEAAHARLNDTLHTLVSALVPSESLRGSAAPFPLNEQIACVDTPCAVRQATVQFSLRPTNAVAKQGRSSATIPRSWDDLDSL